MSATTADTQESGALASKTHTFNTVAAPCHQQITEWSSTGKVTNEMLSMSMIIQQGGGKVTPDDEFSRQKTRTHTSFPMMLY